MILLSIVIPIYNVEKYLNRCFQSLMTSTPDNIEIILVDDGSKDESGNIANDFANRNKHVICYHKTNGGLSDARNYGLLKASGKYVWFVDSDDYIADNSIDKIISCLMDDDIDILSFAAKKIFNDSNEIINFTISDSVLSGKEFLLLQYSNHTFQPEVWHNIYRREFLIDKQIQFKKGLLHEDEEYSPKAFYYANSVKVIDDALYFYVIRENSIMTQKDLSQNFIDLGSTICEYLNLEFDPKIRRLIIDRFVDKYLSVYAKGDLCNRNDIVLLNSKVLLKYAYFLRTKIKVFIFCVNKRLFCALSKSINKG